VVQTTSHGMRLAEYDWLTSFEAVVAAGVAPIEMCAPSDAALLRYDSDAGASGAPVSHADLLAAADAVIASADIRPTDETLAWLPMAWFGDALASQALALSVGFTCNCPERPETARRDLREIGPTILIAPPHVWESLLADIATRAVQSTALKRTLFARFRAVAERVERHREAGENVPAGLQIRHALGEALAHAPLRDQIGLRRLRWASTGGEPLAPAVLHGLRAFGINLRPGHGMPQQSSAVWEPAHA